MVEIFKTNVSDKNQAEQLIGILSQYFPACSINFDLDDCDKILRVEGDHSCFETIRMIVNENGFLCEAID